MSKIEFKLLIIAIITAFKTCQRSSPTLAKCVKDSIELIRPKLKSGDFGNGFAIDPFEPMKIDDILIQKNGLFVHLTNIKSIGASNFIIDKLRINTDHFKVDVIVNVPRIDAIGQYKVQMALGILNINGDGDMKAHLGKYLKFHF